MINKKTGEKNLSLNPFSADGNFISIKIAHHGPPWLPMAPFGTNTCVVCADVLTRHKARNRHASAQSLEKPKRHFRFFFGAAEVIRRWHWKGGVSYKTTWCFFSKHLWQWQVMQQVVHCKSCRVLKKNMTPTRNTSLKNRIFQSSPTSTPWKLDPKNPEDADFPHEQPPLFGKERNSLWMETFSFQIHRAYGNKVGGNPKTRK